MAKSSSKAASWVARVPQRIVIVGAGHAGGTAAALLRKSGHAGEIVLIGEEPFVPYQRPPLSKAFLKNEAGRESLLLKSESFYAGQRIQLSLGTRAVSIDCTDKKVVLERGDPVSYDTLILATGSRARRLQIPGVTLHGVHELRTIADAESIRGLLGDGRRLAIIGGGCIGLEAAASARALGSQVMVIERESRCLARVASEPLSALFEQRHRAEGVEIVTDATVAAFESDMHGAISAVRLHDGRQFACDAALVGVGAAACDELALAAKLACEGGVVVDEDARTSDPCIFALGDMTRRPMPFYENRLFRLESVPNALEQARRAVAAILSLPAPVPEVPWFWSDQYDMKLQIAGLSFDVDDMVVRHGPSARAFTVFHLRQSRVRAVEAVNAPGEFLMGKRLIASAARVLRDRLADSSVPAKDLIA